MANSNKFNKATGMYHPIEADENTIGVKDESIESKNFESFSKIQHKLSKLMEHSFLLRKGEVTVDVSSAKLLRLLLDEYSVPYAMMSSLNPIDSTEENKVCILLK